MTQTTLAAGDLLTAIPSLWESAQIPLAIIANFLLFWLIRRRRVAQGNS